MAAALAAWALVACQLVAPYESQPGLGAARDAARDATPDAGPVDVGDLDGDLARPPVGHAKHVPARLTLATCQ